MPEQTVNLESCNFEQRCVPSSPSPFPPPSNQASKPKNYELAPGQPLRPRARPLAAAAGHSAQVTKPHSATVLLSVPRRGRRQSEFQREITQVKKTGVQKLSLRSQTVKLIFCKSRSDCDDVSNRSNPVVTKTVGETSWDEKVWEVRWRVYLWSGETTCSLQLTRWSQMEEIPMISLTF